MSNVKYIATDDSVSLHKGSKSVTIPSSSHKFKAVIAALEESDDQAAFEIALDGNLRETVSENLEGRINIEDGVLFYDGMVLDNSLTIRIIDMVEAGYKRETRRLIAFLENLLKNPSYRAVNELYSFLEACRVPLTEDGHFLAYKKIRNNFTDIYSGNISNAVGQTVKMARMLVNEDPNQTCSAGLHVCSKEYLSSGYASTSGNRIVAVKVNPRDVVAVPTDYNNSKMRVCEYTVIEEIEHNPEADLDQYLNTIAFPDSEDDEEDDYDYEYLDDYASSEVIIIDTYPTRANARSVSQTNTNTKVIDFEAYDIPYGTDSSYEFRWAVVKK